MTQPFFNPNQQQVYYQQQPNQGTPQQGYYQQHYQGQPQQAYYQQPPQIQQSASSRSMATIALICFAVAWITGIASIIPILGYAFLCFALVVHLAGFIFLALAIAKWPR